MKRLFAFAKRTPPPKAPTVSDGVAGWVPMQNYPSATELTQMMPGGIYQFDQLIGQGGMGAVYRGRQLNLGRSIAIKILHRHHGADYAYAERFRREAQALAQMNHPNIVSVYDFGLVGDYLFYVMEYVEGTDLHHAVSLGQLTQARVLEILPDVCDALSYAHSKGIVHRDIKPANILIANDGRVKVADFGLAKRFDQQHGIVRPQCFKPYIHPLFIHYDDVSAVGHRAIDDAGIGRNQSGAHCCLIGRRFEGHYRTSSPGLRRGGRTERAIVRITERELGRHKQKGDACKRRGLNGCQPAHARLGQPKHIPCARPGLARSPQPHDLRLAHSRRLGGEALLELCPCGMSLRIIRGGSVLVTCNRFQRIAEIALFDQSGLKLR